MWIESAGRKRILLGLALWTAAAASGQIQNYYTPTANVTGQLALTQTVDVSPFLLPGSQQVSASRPAEWSPTGARPGRFESFLGAESPRAAFRRMPRIAPALAASASLMAVAAESLGVKFASSGSGFNGISHFDQRNASSGNQFSVEPPSPSVAVANGYVLEGVNNAVQVFATTGKPLIQTISSNQLFGLAPAINRTTGANGPYPTDMRVFFDSDINRWFVLQRAQDVDVSGNSLNTSHIYLAVSQSPDPTAVWNVYVMDTTDAGNPGCPCLSDYVQIGADQFGVYITANEYDTTYFGPVDATILAISKAALGAGGTAPTTYRFNLPLSFGYEFALQPASTPPGASKYLASGGVEYFVSSQAEFSGDSNLAVWALSNTASLRGGLTSLLLTETTVPLTLGDNTLSYVYPYIATQPTGPLPLGSSLEATPFLPFLDGGPDSRVQSVTYSGGRLYAAFPTQVLDSAGNSVVGGAYVIMAPTFRSDVLAARVLKQGYLSVVGNHVLRPAISVDANGVGAVCFTLVGPDYFPSAAFAALDTTYPNAGIIDPTAPSAATVAASGVSPEDGFTAYPPQPTAPVARWGDYSGAVTSTDGSIWMVAEYIPNAPRSQLANWGTFIFQYIPPQQ